jgi:transmembrane sensor
VSQRALAATALSINVSASTRQSPDQRIAEEAAQWLIDLEDGEADTAAFAAWLQASPRHVEEFLLISAVWRAADRIDEAHAIEIDQLVAQARDNVKRLDDETIGRQRTLNVPRRMQTALRSRLTAAVALLAIMGAVWLGLHDDALSYRTAVGEQRIVKLPDGSIVTLNTRSQIKVRMEKTERSIELIQGEALFDVAHDAERPFRVLAGPTVVQAIGTQFNVYRTASGTTVSVVEGIVEVTSRTEHPARAGGAVATLAPERLTAGQQAQVSAHGEVVHHAAAELDRVVAWRERRLIFRSEPLAAIAAEFNRYNDTQLRIEGATTSARRVTGVFDADKPGALVAFLEGDPQLTVETRGHEVVIRGP